MSVHDGHRQRLKDRFLESGLDGFTQVQALELLLFYCIPRKDTNAIAHALLERFGSLAGVMDASVEELCTVPGIGANAATLLHLVPEMSRFYLVSRMAKNDILQTQDDCAAYLLPRFFGRTVETVYLLCLDAKCKVLCCREVGDGIVNAAGISVRRIMEVALAANASSVVLAHNHPSGMALPSYEDLQATVQIGEALRAVDIVLADHIIVADDDYVSLAQSGYKLHDRWRI